MNTLKEKHCYSFPCFGFVCVGKCSYKSRCKFLHDDRLICVSNRCHEYKTNQNFYYSSKEDSFFYPMLNCLPNDNEMDDMYFKYNVDIRKTDVYAFSMWQMFTTIVPIHSYINNLQENPFVSENEIEQLYEIGTDVFQNKRRLSVFRYLSLGLPFQTQNVNDTNFIYI